MEVELSCISNKYTKTIYNLQNVVNDTFSAIGLIFTVLGLILPNFNKFLHKIQSIQNHFRIKLKNDDSSINDRDVITFKFCDIVYLMFFDLLPINFSCYCAKCCIFYG